MDGGAAWPDVALDLWRFTARERTAIAVLPDGRRDLIVVVPRTGARMDDADLMDAIGAAVRPRRWRLPPMRERPGCRSRRGTR